MLLEQLASLSDDWSMLQKSSCFCLKKLNPLSMLIKSYTDAVTVVNDFFQISRLAAKIAINSFCCFLILNYGKTIGVARIFDWEGGAKPQMTCNDVIRNF